MCWRVVGKQNLLSKTNAFCVYSGIFCFIAVPSIVLLLHTGMLFFLKHKKTPKPLFFCFQKVYKYVVSLIDSGPTLDILVNIFQFDVILL